MKKSKSEDSYKTCSICKTIPESSGAFWIGGDLRSDPLPASTKYLDIVGAPFYDASTSYSHSCLKQCPECGTYYLWEMEYEYFPSGSEDEITLTRLSDSEGQKRAEKIFQEIEGYKNWFNKHAAIHIKTLRKENSGKKFEKATNFFYYEQMSKGMDISFAVKDLVKALAKHSHSKEEYCSAEGDLQLALGDFIDKSPKNKKKILDIIQKLDIKRSPPELEAIIKMCKSTDK